MHLVVLMIVISLVTGIISTESSCDGDILSSSKTIVINMEAMKNTSITLVSQMREWLIRA